MKVAIIGSGIIGLHTALYLIKSGCEVSVFEKSAESGGASTRNAGMIVPSHFVPLATKGVLGQALRWMFKKGSPLAFHSSFDTDMLKWAWKFLKASQKADQSEENLLLLKMNMESRNLYDEIIAEYQLNVGYKPKGLIMFCKTPEGLSHEAELAKKSIKLGMQAEILNAGQTRNLNPGLETDLVGSVFYPNDAFFSTEPYIKSLKNILISKGVSFYENEEISAFQLNANKISGFQTSSGIQEGFDQIVLSSGVESSSLLKKLGLRVPLLSGKGYSITLKDSPAKMEICGLLSEARIAMTPMLEGLRIGGTMEIGAPSQGINRAKVNGIFKAVPEFFPDFQQYDFNKNQIWSGLRPISPDGMPYLGKADKITNLTIASGHSMMGLSLAPITGKLIAGYLTENKSMAEQLELKQADNMLNPMRFH